MRRSRKDTILISILACLWAVQAAVIAQQLLSLCHAPAFLNDLLLPEALPRMAGKWDILVYVLFIAVALITGKAMLRCYHKPFNYWLLLFEGVLTFLMVSALFKMLIYAAYNSQLAQRALMVLIAVSLVSKIFYPELRKFIEVVYQRSNIIAWAPYADAWWMVVIVFLIYMPDLERVIALIFIGDWTHHFDFIEMSVGWASLWGQLPYVDVISQYGVGLPIIFARIADVFGGFEYVPTLAVMMWFVIIYFILSYFFVRYWLGSALMAGMAFLLIFRLQMFHYGVSPLIWCTPSASPLRFGLDILWIMALLLHMRTGHQRWLLLAACYSGFAFYYMTSNGMCVAVTFYAYFLALIFFPSFRRQTGPSRRWLYYLSGGLPLISAFVFFGATLKGHMFQKEYWHNLFDYMTMFGTVPMFESLKYRHFWAFFMSIVVPFTYIATLLYIGICLYLKKGPMERLFVALLCIYGLANYQYYVVRSAITSYYVNALPFVFISCFWFARYLEFLPLIWQKRLKAGAVFLSFYALLTNQNYLAYPNLMNVSRNPMTDNLVIQRFPDRTGFFNNQYKKVKEEDKLSVNDLGGTQEDLRTEDDFKNDQELVAYYRRYFDFQQDAALIDRLTKSGERVALVSSFETKILIQARRPPFFYHFPLLSSRPMTFRGFPSDAAHTSSFLADTLGELEKRRPEYVFMENIFMQDALPSSYYNSDNRRLERVMTIIAYIKSRYQPFKHGEYLIAMKRKSGI